MWTFETRMAAINGTIATADGTIARFTSMFAEDPSRALVWGDSLYEAVARKGIYERIRRIITATKNQGLENKLDLDAAENNAIGEARRVAARMLTELGSTVASQSTGVCSTFFRRCEIQEWAKLNADYHQPLELS